MKPPYYLDAPAEVQQSLYLQRREVEPFPDRGQLQNEDCAPRCRRGRRTMISLPRNLVRMSGFTPSRPTVRRLSVRFQTLGRKAWVCGARLTAALNKIKV